MPFINGHLQLFHRIDSLGFEDVKLMIIEIYVSIRVEALHYALCTIVL